MDVWGLVLSGIGAAPVLPLYGYAPMKPF